MAFGGSLRLNWWERGGIFKAFGLPVCPEKLKRMGSNIQVFDENGLLLDEFEPGLRVFTHQIFKNFVGQALILDLDLNHGAGLFIHGGFFQIRWRHFSQTLEPAHLIRGTVEFVYDRVFFRIIQCVKQFFARIDPEQGGLGDEEIAFLNEFGHITIKESQQ